MARKNQESPSYSADPTVEQARPAVGGLVEAFIEAYAPPIEPFRIVMPGGEILLFAAVQGSGDWKRLVDESTKMAARLIEGIPVRLAQVASRDPQRNALAFVCAETMVGWYPKSKPSEDAGGRVPDGDMEPKWSFENWLKLADRSPTVFDAIHAKVDAGQVDMRRRFEGRTIAAEKKS